MRARRTTNFIQQGSTINAQATKYQHTTISTVTQAISKAIVAVIATLATNTIIAIPTVIVVIALHYNVTKQKQVVSYQS